MRVDGERAFERVLDGRKVFPDLLFKIRFRVYGGLVHFGLRSRHFTEFQRFMQAESWKKGAIARALDSATLTALVPYAIQERPQLPRPAWVPSFRSALASICRMRSRVTAKLWPTSAALLAAVFEAKGLLALFFIAGSTASP